MINEILAWFVRQCHYFLSFFLTLIFRNPDKANPYAYEAINSGLDLSEDVLIEILARLPVKSLLKFKSVCKSWHDLIENPNFVIKHLNCYTPFNDDEGIIVKHGYHDELSIVTFLSNEAGQKSSDGAMHFFFNLDETLQDIVFFGPCNGIICVLGNLNPRGSYFGWVCLPYPLALWNPATKKIKHLPNPHPFNKEDDLCMYLKQIGFGFDATSNDYKVVRIIGCRRRFSDTLIQYPLVEVYNLSTDSWREIDVVPPTMQFFSAFSIYLNGFYYWWALDDDENFILSFDFANEVFHKIPSPPGVTNLHSVCLMNFNESLALVADTEFCEEKLTIHIWVLKNMNGGDGENIETWTKLYSIPLFGNVRMVGLLRSGEALLVMATGPYDDYDDELALYDPNTHKLKSLRGYDNTLCGIYTFQAVNYVESLVSFKDACDLNSTDVVSRRSQVDSSKRKRLPVEYFLRPQEYPNGRKRISCNWFQFIWN